MNPESCPISFVAFLMKIHWPAGLRKTDGEGASKYSALKIKNRLREPRMIRQYFQLSTKKCTGHSNLTMEGVKPKTPFSLPWECPCRKGQRKSCPFALSRRPGPGQRIICSSLKDGRKKECLLKARATSATKDATVRPFLKRPELLWSISFLATGKGHATGET